MPKNEFGLKFYFLCIKRKETVREQLEDDEVTHKLMEKCEVATE